MAMRLFKGFETQYCLALVLVIGWATLGCSIP